MRTTILWTLLTLLLPLLPADIIILANRERVDGIISGFQNGELTVRRMNATAEIRIPISQVVQFTIVRTLTEPTQPVPLTATPRRDDLRQRSEDRRTTQRVAQLSNRYSDLLRRGDQLREEAFNIQFAQAGSRSTSRVERERAQQQAQLLLDQAEQFYVQARTVQQQLEELGYPVDRTPPPPQTGLIQPPTGLPVQPGMNGPEGGQAPPVPPQR